MNQNLTDQITAALKAEPKILASYIIGSTTTNSTRPDSNFDLVVVVDHKTLQLESRIYDLLQPLPSPKNLDLSVVDKDSSPTLLFKTARDGKRIYTRNEKEILNFEAFTMHNYFDNEHIRNIYAMYNK